VVETEQVEKIKGELEQLQGMTQNAAPYFSAEKEAFLDTLVTEATQIQKQAHSGSMGDEEQPLFIGGLIPSADGFRWREVSA
jgi:hypothetical protein